MRFFLLIIFVILQISCGPMITQGGYVDDVYESDPMPPGPECYVKCLTSISYGNDIIEYTGNDFDDTNVTKARIIVKEADSKWVKKKDDKDCLSANPEDCMVWCLVKEKPDYYKYYTLKDTSVNKEFKIIKLNPKKSVSKRTWVEVLCDTEIDSKLYHEMLEALIDLTYLTEVDRQEDSEFNYRIENAMSLFQTDNYLPECPFSIESLSLLKVLD